MPVAHAVKRQNPKLLFESFRLGLRPLAQGRVTADLREAVRHLFENLRRNRAAAADEVELLRHILDALGRAMAQQEYRLLHGRKSRTISTTAFTFSTGVSGRMPWPRLKIWPGRAPVRLSSS
jgi:hypothetical protein